MLPTSSRALALTCPEQRGPIRLAIHPRPGWRAATQLVASMRTRRAEWLASKARR